MSDSGDIALFARNARRKRKAVSSANELQAVEENTPADVTPKYSTADGNGAADATFKSLGVTSSLAQVCTSLGMRRPTAIQVACIPQILQVSLLLLVHPPTLLQGSFLPRHKPDRPKTLSAQRTPAAARRRRLHCQYCNAWPSRPLVYSPWC